jgi:TolA-binding protein
MKNLKKPRNYKLLAYALVLALAGIGGACENHRAKREFDSGRKLYDQGSYLEAIRNWETVLGSYPKSDWSDDALHWIGVTYYVNLDLPDRAVAAFARLVKDHPDSSYAPEDQILVAEIFRSQNKFAEALTEYARFLKMFPEHAQYPKIWFRLITCLFEVGEFDALRVQGQALLKKYPSSEWSDDALYWVGESYFLQGDQKKAQENFSKYLSAYPQGELAFKARMGIARSLEEEGSLKEAIELYRTLKTEYPSEKSVAIRLQSAQKRHENKQSGALEVPYEERPAPTPAPTP